MRLKEAISQLKNERRQDKKAIGYKSKIALSGSNNGIIGFRGYRSPDFAMTKQKFIYRLILFYQWLNCYYIVLNFEP